MPGNVRFIFARITTLIATHGQFFPKPVPGGAALHRVVTFPAFYRNISSGRTIPVPGYFGVKTTGANQLLPFFPDFYQRFSGTLWASHYIMCSQIEQGYSGVCVTMHRGV
jgi:hypothetical protein